MSLDLDLPDISFFFLIFNWSTIDIQLLPFFLLIFLLLYYYPEFILNLSFIVSCHQILYRRKKYLYIQLKCLGPFESFLTLLSPTHVNRQNGHSILFVLRTILSCYCFCYSTDDTILRLWWLRITLDSELLENEWWAPFSLYSMGMGLGKLHILFVLQFLYPKNRHNNSILRRG